MYDLVTCVSAIKYYFCIISCNIGNVYIPSSSSSSSSSFPFSSFSSSFHLHYLRTNCQMRKTSPRKEEAQQIFINIKMNRVIVIVTLV